MATDAASRGGTNAAALAAVARERFEAGEFGAAREGFAAAFAAGDDSAETVAALQALYADAGEHAAVARLLGEYLDRVEDRLPAGETARWAATLFDAVVLSAAEPERRTEAALRLLEAAAAGSLAEGWAPVLEPGRREALEAAFVGPLALLELLEQESYAPEATGLPAGAVARAEEIGRRYAADPAIARAAERLLHALGEREAAYRVEAARRAGRGAVAGARGRAGEYTAEDGDRDGDHAADLRGMVVTVVGGHPGLRALVRRDLARSGAAQVREVPSKWEGAWGGRAVQERVAGADVVVLIGRRVAHSTAGQARAAATRLGVPVVVAATAGAAAVRRAIKEWATREQARGAPVLENPVEPTSA